MLIQIDEQITFEVIFDPLDREVGYDDDIRFAIHESANQSVRIFGTDTTSILLTSAQAERLAYALLIAAEASRNTPN